MIIESVAAAETRQAASLQQVGTPAESAAIPVFDKLLIGYRVRHRFRATFSRQPRQVRKEATVTGSFVCSGSPVPGFFAKRRRVPMTNRLYYPTSDLHEFDSVVQEILPQSPEQGRSGVILRETAFYPASGGQTHDTGWLITPSNDRVRVAEVVETEDGRIVHYLEVPAKLAPGTAVHGNVDPERRRDHMQQHSGQHVLSAAFI